MRVEINLYTGERFGVTVEPTDDIETVKKSIKQQIEAIASQHDARYIELSGISIADFRLTPHSAGVRIDVEEMSNLMMLADYGVQDGDVLNLMVVPGMKFCRECNNMLYPKAQNQDDSNALYYFCRHCKRDEATTLHCVYRNEVKRRLEGDKEAHIRDIVSDPTLPHTNSVQCPKCDFREAVFFHSHLKSDDRAMSVFFACCHCYFKWQSKD